MDCIMCVHTEKEAQGYTGGMGGGLLQRKYHKRFSHKNYHDHRNILLGPFKVYTLCYYVD